MNYFCSISVTVEQAQQNLFLFLDLLTCFNLMWKRQHSCETGQNISFKHRLHDVSLGTSVVCIIYHFNDRRFAGILVLCNCKYLTKTFWTTHFKISSSFICNLIDAYLFLKEWRLFFKYIKYTGIHIHRVTEWQTDR